MTLLPHDHGRPLGTHTLPNMLLQDGMARFGGFGAPCMHRQWHAPDVERQVLAVDHALHTASKPSSSVRGKTLDP